MSLFTITFTQKLDADHQEIEDKAILDIFSKKFWETGCDGIKVTTDNHIKISNNLIRIKFNMGLDLWLGIKRADLKIKKDRMFDRDICYSINISPMIIILSIQILFVILTVPGFQTSFILNILSFFFAYALVVIGIQVLRHYFKFRNIFRFILKSHQSVK